MHCTFDHIQANKRIKYDLKPLSNSQITLHIVTVTASVESAFTNVTEASASLWFLQQIAGTVNEYLSALQH